ncbi:putative glycolipid-binding domain-containing protein [Xanthomonas translucens pv. translucens]|nr:putative glycolipid-binding domain-containing protein [Xanthomonas translucens]MCS3360532.1 putative glycolipid-binding domain-containing protein [Xanthomonas translucens pv. translucens]MCS3374324.1 putative glycolipid-binding domain-containing protein [Xanthomonas translucens pv. translucens]MCT8275395.1 putative glycolipid-binding domain-containing protein [Xanthomonas translucens pv. translucens]MCT8279066.1 putative glycolipid-binding domain-containing protein [Xanthomonas translucens p
MARRRDGRPRDRARCAWPLEAQRSAGGRRVALHRPRPRLHAGHQPAATAPASPGSGRGADASAAWVDLDGGGTLSELVQRYARTADDAYAYQAKRFGYAATLCAIGEGFVRDYPGLWTAEA